MIAKYNFTAIDFETANEARGSACSIGLARVETGVIVDTFYSLICPDPLYFNPRNVAIHNITAEMCKRAPTMVQLWPQLKPWIEGQILVGHNVSFERSVLNHFYLKESVKDPALDYLCTLYLSKVHLNGLQNYSLPTVYKSLFEKEVNHHDALEDAKACAEIAIKIAMGWNPPSFEGMVGALYEKPRAERKTTWNKPNINMLTPDRGFEDDRRLKGFCFCFTNELADFTREEAAQFVVNRGGKVSAGLTKSVTTLVVGSIGKGATNKINKAQEYNQKGAKIEVIGEEEFLEMVGMLAVVKQLV